MKLQTEAGSRLKYIKKLMLLLLTLWDNFPKCLYLTPNQSKGEPVQKKERCTCNFQNVYVMLMTECQVIINYLLLLVVLDTLWNPTHEKTGSVQVKNSRIRTEKCTWHYNTAHRGIKYYHFLTHWHIFTNQYIFYFLTCKMFYVGVLYSIYFYLLFPLKEFSIKYMYKNKLE